MPAFGSSQWEAEAAKVFVHGSLSLSLGPADGRTEGYFRGVISLFSIQWEKECARGNDKVG